MSILLQQGAPLLYICYPEVIKRNACTLRFLTIDQSILLRLLY